jgi:nucleotide-binding universal stress UspA family protein
LVTANEKDETMIRTILVPLAENLASESLLDTALSLAKKFDAHLRAAFIRPDAESVRVIFPEIFGGAAGAYRELEQKMRQAETDERQCFENWYSRNTVSTGAKPDHAGWSANWSLHIGDIETIVTRLGRVHDLIVVQRPTSKALAAQRCFDAAVFGSGRPTLVMPERHPRDMTDHIMIAWNGSVEATRAVAFAMPFLRSAKRVSIFTALEYGAEAGDLGDLAEALHWHGIRTPEVRFPHKAEPTTSALASAAKSQEATMLVMGAYTHSRLRQKFLGGVTEHLLAQTTIPLLMCH